MRRKKTCWKEMLRSPLNPILHNLASRAIVAGMALISIFRSLRLRGVQCSVQEQMQKGCETRVLSFAPFPYKPA